MHEVQKTDINPQTGKAYAVNPSTGQWDDNFWATQVDPVVNKDFKAQQQAQAQQQQYQQQQQQAQQQYQQNVNTAVSGLQARQQALPDQYKALLDQVMNTGNQAGSLAIGQASAELGARGINPASGYGQNALMQAELPVQTAYGTLAANIGLGEQSDLNTLAQNIANLQGGGAGTLFGGQQSAGQFAAGLPLQYGSLSLASQALPSQIFNNFAQGSASMLNPQVQLQAAQIAALKPFAVNGPVYRPGVGFAMPGQ